MVKWQSKIFTNLYKRKSIIMRRIIIIICLLSLIAQAKAYDFCVDNIYYNITSETNLTVEVTYQSEMNHLNYCAYEGDITIPSFVEHNGKKYTVTRIGEYAFGTYNGSVYIEQYGYRLKSIKLPQTIESIGYCAFWWCDALTEIIIPQSVKKIEGNVFAGCNHLQTCYLLAYNPPTTVFGDNINAFRNDYDIWIPNLSKYIADNTWQQYGNRLKEIVTPRNNYFIYTGEKPQISYTTNASDLSECSYTFRLEKNAGKYSTLVHFRFFKDRKEYISFDDMFTYEIAKKTLTLDIKNATCEYGEESPSFEYENLTGFVEGEGINNLDQKPYLYANRNKYSDAGDYIISAFLIDKNYDVRVNNYGTLKVTKAPLTVKVCDFSKEYGSPLNPQELKFQYEGLKNNDILSNPSFKIVSTAETYSDVGNYKIYASGGYSNNYDFKGYSPGTLTVTPATLEIIAKDTIMIYGDQKNNFRYTCRGLLKDDKLIKEPQVSTTALLNSPAEESFDIIANGADAGKNYAITYTKGKLYIYPKVLDVYANDCEKEYNQENPIFSTTYRGFVNGEDESIITTKPYIYSEARKSSNPGRYSICVDGGSAKNYTLKYHTGILTIKKAKQVINWEQEFDDIKIGDQVELLAKASSNLPIEYRFTSDKGEVYSVGEKQFLDCQKGGTITISASQPGNYLYDAALRCSKTFIINEITGIDNINAEGPKISAYYDLAGRKMNKPQKGINIILYKNGKKKTVIIK